MINETDYTNNPLTKEQENTTIYLLGTAHQETTHYKTDDLAEILNKIKPDLILMEYDSTFFNAQFELKRVSECIEDLAVIKYRTVKPVPIRPYDIEGRNQFYRENRYFETLSEMVNDVKVLRNTGKLVDEASFELDLFDKVSMAKGFWLQDRPDAKTLNSKLGDQIVKTEHELRYAIFRRIIEITPELHKYRQFITLVIDEWYRRNKSMADNIAKWTEKFPKSKITVLVGAEHRYILHELLAERKLSVKEFYE